MEPDRIVIEPMAEPFILWRCLHRGPLSPASIEQWPSGDGLPWPTFRARNLPLPKKLVATYGTCAMLARDGEQVVGFLRFYPKAIASLEEAGGLCLQQASPAGPSARLVEMRFPPLEEMPDKVLTVHCLMSGSPQQERNPYQRQGIGTRLVQALAAWARAEGGQAIEATAYEDLSIIYAVTGQAGKRFWEKLGFQLVRTETEPDFAQEDEFADFVKALREQAGEQGMDFEQAKNRYTMRLELTA